MNEFVISQVNQPLGNVTDDFLNNMSRQILPVIYIAKAQSLDRRAQRTKCETQVPPSTWVMLIEVAKKLWNAVRHALHWPKQRVAFFVP